MSSPARPEPGDYLATLLERAPIGVVRLGGDGSIASSNPYASELLEVPARDLEGRSLDRFFWDEDAVSKMIAGVIATGDEDALRVQRGPSESPTYIELKVYRFDEGSGLGAVALLQDVTERVVVALQREEILSQVEFLAETSARLGSSVDVGEVFEQLADIVIPMLADWCVLDVVYPDGTLERVGVRHRDPDKAEAADILHVYRPDPEQRQHPVVRALTKERPVVLTDIDDEDLVHIAFEPEHRAIVEGLGARSALVVPLRARGRLIGSLTLVSATNPKRFGAHQLALAQDIGSRAALALDNARLLKEHIYLARKLQESLLPPESPQVPGLEVAACYRSAGEGIEVGGDFYDYFKTGSKSWSVVIGDVSGKGPDAAVITTLARYTIRAAAMQARAPRRILGLLNEAIYKQTDHERFVTCAFVRVRTDGGPGAKKVTVACGGHPLPLALKNDGTIEEVGTPGTALGLTERADIKDSTSTLQPGDALVLFTDGVTEARSGDVMLGIEGVRSALHQCAGRSARQIADHLAQTALEYQRDAQKDDLAIVVLKVPSEES